MSRNNALPSKDEELNELIAKYEEMQEVGKSLYLDGDQLAEIADFYATEQRMEEAQAVITYGLQLHPGHFELLVEQAYLYLDNKEIEKAQEVARSIAEEHSSEVKFLNAEILLNQARVEEAELLINSIEDKDDLDVIIEIAYLYLNTGYVKYALPWLTENIEEYKENENFIAVLADCLAADEQIEEALVYYNILIDKAPFHAPYWLSLGRCYYNDKKYEQALEAAEFALAADAHSGEAYLIKAHSLLYMENESEAVPAYEKALEYNAVPIHFARMFIGLACLNKQEWEKAEANFAQSLKELEEQELTDEIEPILLLDIYCNQIICLARLKRFEEAHQKCEKLQLLYPGNAEPFLLQGRVYLFENKSEEAYAKWEIATEYDSSADTWHQAGTYCLEFNKAQQALYYLEQAAKREPAIEGIYEELAAVCMYLQDVEKFNKYNQLSDDPINFAGLNKQIKEKGADGVFEELRDLLKFIAKNDEEK